MAINVGNLVVKGEMQDKSSAIESGVANLVVENKQPKRKVIHRVIQDDENVKSVVERFYKDSPYVRDMINN